MGVKTGILGMLIYSGMAAYAAAFATLLCGARRSGRALFAAAFVLSVAAVVVRWSQVRHAPMQNLFEVFGCLAALVFPLSCFWRRFLAVGGEAFDALLGFVMLLPAGLFLSADPQRLPPALQHWLFVPHVAAYVLSYLILIKAAALAVQRIAARVKAGPDRPDELEQATFRMVRLGLPLLTAGLILGASWGKIAWGDYWNWDPKELWSLATWLIYVGYLHFRYLLAARYPRANSAIVVLGALTIVITLLWVNLSRTFSGLHSYA